MKRVFAICLLLLGFCILPVSAQYRLAMPAWSWSDIDGEQAALWHNGVQVGALMIDTLTYYPRYGQGRWGSPEDPPVKIPQKYIDQYGAVNKKKNRWREQGVMGPNGDSTIPNTGLHINKRKAAPSPRRSVPPPKIRSYPQAALEAGANEVPAFDDMASITFVSNDDGSKAYAALDSFLNTPDVSLEPFRQMYGQRAKAYSFADFKHTGAAFKLDEDRTFAKTGFVALVQPDAPDENDEAFVHPIYEFVSATQFAGALRDVKPNYDPNPPDAPPLSDEWQPWHYGAAGALGIGTFAMLGAAAAYRKRHAAMI